MKTIALLAILALAAGCTNQQGVRSAGSPHMVNRAQGNAIIAVMIKDFNAEQEAAKAQSVDALKGSVAATGQGNADSTATIKPADKEPAEPKPADTVIVPDLPPAPKDLEAPLPEDPTE